MKVITEKSYSRNCFMTSLSFCIHFNWQIRNSTQKFTHILQRSNKKKTLILSIHAHFMSSIRLEVLKNYKKNDGFFSKGKKSQTQSSRPTEKPTLLKSSVFTFFFCLFLHCENWLVDRNSLASGFEYWILQLLELLLLFFFSIQFRSLFSRNTFLKKIN